MNDKLLDNALFGNTYLTATEAGIQNLGSEQAFLAPVEVVTIGEAMGLVVLPPNDYHGHAGECVVSFGGAESNVAIGLARLGVSAGWASALGNDFFGDLIRKSLASEGVSVFAKSTSDSPTGTMFKTATTEGRRDVRYFRSHSAASQLSSADVPESVLSSARILHLTGIFPALSPSAREATLSAIEIARKHDCLVSFDINYRDALWPANEASDFVHAVLKDIDILFGGEDELRILGGDSGIHELVEALADSGPSEVVVKRGAEGAKAFANGSWCEQQALEVEVVDTVGAGDAFVAGYLYELLSSADVSERLKTAAITGGLATSHLGDWQGFPSIDVLQQKKKEVR